LFGALSVFGRRIEGMIRLRPKKVWTCSVARHHRRSFLFFFRLGAHWQLYLLNYLVARVENTALYESARTGNFSVVATGKLQPDPFSRQQK
jgi:hypothetical protein